MQENLDEKIKLIHNILIAVSTGTNITPILNQNYSQLRNELLSSKYKDLLPIYVKSSLDLKQFWAVIKNESPTYQGRREILNKDFLLLEKTTNNLAYEKYHVQIFTKSKKYFYKLDLEQQNLEPFIRAYHYAENILIDGTTILSSDIASIKITRSSNNFKIYQEKAQIEHDREREKDLRDGLIVVTPFSAQYRAFNNMENVTDRFILYPLGELSIKQPINTTVNEGGNRLKKVFISHATKDRKIVEELIDLLETIGINSTQIFCSSFEGYGIPLGEDFLATIKQELSAEVLVLFVITNNFYASKVCLCEMGAAWALSKGHIPIVVPPLSYSDIQGVIPLTQGMLINDFPKLNSLKEKLENDFGFEQKIGLNTWERKRDRFVNNINELIEF
ncbi:toll/interleukin-1 receptor domain-containing protein [Acinetobacter brisouii]|uniref:toll/interleukin-1 receptor domain-containing protein n=1 Tax=Acinetobacter brisouii TaxID=396323 RepID=UPI0035B06CE3